MAPPRPPRTSITRANLLDVALALWVEGGTAAMTIEALRARSGLSTGSIYHHFRDKDDVLESLYLALLERYHAGLVKSVTRPRSAEASIKGVVRWHLQWVRRHPAWKRFLLNELVISRPENVARKVEMDRLLFTALEAWRLPHVVARRLADLPWELMHALVLGPAQMFCRQWLTGTSPRSYTRALALFPTAAWKAVAPTRSPHE